MRVQKVYRLMALAMLIMIVNTARGAAVHNMNEWTSAQEYYDQVPEESKWIL